MRKKHVHVDHAEVSPEDAQALLRDIRARQQLAASHSSFAEPEENWFDRNSIKIIIGLVAIACVACLAILYFDGGNP